MPVRRILSVVVVASLVFAAAPASAGILGMSMSAGDISSLHLPDGSWDYGPTGDWYYEVSPTDSTYAQAYMYEEWVSGRSVDFDMTIEADTDPNVRIVKTLDNDTNFAWTDFHIDLIPQPGLGPIVVNPASVDSDRFSDVMVMNNPDGSANIWWFSNFGLGDTPVQIGEYVTLDFTFNIPGTVAFKMRQTPTPEPAGLALLTLGGLALIRRKR